MKKILPALLMLPILIAALSGCGGSGGSTQTQPTTAVVKLAIQGVLASGSQIAGVTAILALPGGVTVKSAPDSQNPSVLVTTASVVAATGTAGGANTQVIATYRAAAGATAGAVTINLVNPDGFGAGEFVVVNCDISSGSNPIASDFGVTAGAIKDLNGSAINGLAMTHTADIR